MTLRARDEMWISNLGLVDYRECTALQTELRERVAAGELPDRLVYVDHPPVYTLGRRTRAEDLPMGEAWYRDRGIAIAVSDRGGRLTYRGPGQLVGYPIMRVADVGAHVRAIEAAIVTALAGGPASV